MEPRDHPAIRIRDIGIMQRFTYRRRSQRDRTPPERRCRCGTILSRYNPDGECWLCSLRDQR